ncbi:MAG: acyl-CoA/acyl-ACP dehydrogenase [Streptosporangiales bacterium]|nr:acyl-CoA/acyl-ACP dehydrogenase [Streptosporangiales bacterium]
MTVTGAEAAEVREELRDVARSLLAGDPAPSAKRLASAGWTGLEVPEELGGAGVTFAETAVICEELGRAAAVSSFLGAAVLGAGTLLELSPSAARDDLLAAVAAGDATPVAVLPGEAGFVPSAASATHLLVVEPGGVTVAVPGDAGVSVEALPVIDETSRLARVSVSGASGGPVLPFAGDPSAVIGRLRDRAAVAVACDSLGAAEAMLETTVAYVKTREQFGRAVGSFQAVQHACADMLVALRVSRELVSAAVTAVAGGAPDAWVRAAMAKSHACAAAVDVAGQAMQLHGGIGYTWESGVHVYLKRALLNRSLFGSPAGHRQRLATRY